MKIDRMLSMVMLLLQREIISATELAKTFEVSTRTVYRDIDAINLAGIPIVTYPGVYGGVGIMKEYKVDKRLFTSSDIASLLIGLGGIRSALNTDEFTNTLAKVKAMIPQEQLLQLDLQSNQIVIDLTPWKSDNRMADYLRIIKNAIEKKHIIELTYTSAKGDTANRKVEPYRLLHKGNSWYLQGYCLHKNDMRSFRLLRIEHLSDLDIDFSPRQIDLMAMDEGFTKDNPTINVTIKFAEAAKKSVTGFWGENIITSFQDGYYTAQITIADNKYGYKTLLLVSDQCECVAPPKVREYLIAQITAFSKIYSL